jgi:multiple sugar transport system substrate-binding protein
LAYWWWFERFGSAGGQYFDSEMNATINSEAGVRALEDLKDQNQFMAPDVGSYGYIETVEAFGNGKAFATISWPALGKMALDPESSQVVGKVGYAVVPGYEVDGKINKKTTAAPGFSIVVPKSEYSHLGNSEASYLLAQWLTSSENMKEGILDLTGNTDPIRISNFEDPDIQSGLPGGDLFVAAMKNNLAQAWPDLLIPGSAEYSQILEVKIQDYMSGNIDSAQEAMDQAAEEWDKVTEKLGRDRQKAYYQAFSEAFFGAE